MCKNTVCICTIRNVRLAAIPNSAPRDVSMLELRATAVFVGYKHGRPVFQRCSHALNDCANMCRPDCKRVHSWWCSRLRNDETPVYAYHFKDSDQTLRRMDAVLLLSACYPNKDIIQQKLRQLQAGIYVPGRMKCGAVQLT